MLFLAAVSGKPLLPGHLERSADQVAKATHRPHDRSGDQAGVAGVELAVDPVADQCEAGYARRQLGTQSRVPPGVGPAWSSCSRTILAIGFHTDARLEVPQATPRTRPPSCTRHATMARPHSGSIQNRGKHRSQPHHAASRAQRGPVPTLEERQSDSGRENRLYRSPFPPNRTSGCPAHGSPVGGSPRCGLTGQNMGCLHAEQPLRGEERVGPALMRPAQSAPQVPEGRLNRATYQSTVPPELTSGKGMARLPSTSVLG